MEIGSSSPMFTILTTLSLLNLFRLAWFAKEAAIDGASQKVGLQLLLCGIFVVINLPLYKGLFSRMDKGKIPKSVAVKSMAFALLACFSSPLVHCINQFTKFLMFALFFNDLPLM